MGHTSFREGSGRQQFAFMNETFAPIVSRCRPESRSFDIQAFTKAISWQFLVKLLHERVGVLYNGVGRIYETASLGNSTCNPSSCEPAAGSHAARAHRRDPRCSFAAAS